MNAAEHTADHRAAALEARFGLRLTARLSESADQLPHDVTERLRHARQLALAQRQSASSTQVNAAANGFSSAATLSFGGHKGKSWWTSLTALVPVAALLLGLSLIEHFHLQDQIAAAAEVDAALLADDLPPEAYSDPGFVEFLKTSRE
ncbi:MAG: hypothetical protein CFE40_06685 [Burkholderiales bacterium PBB1]|nr:MAG: hypothetical protein CFE40_06685 [Burkholderiales bacterium PBB1]